MKIRFFLVALIALVTLGADECEFFGIPGNRPIRSDFYTDLNGVQLKINVSSDRKFSVGFFDRNSPNGPLWGTWRGGDYRGMTIYKFKFNPDTLPLPEFSYGSTIEGDSLFWCWAYSPCLPDSRGVIIFYKDSTS